MKILIAVSGGVDSVVLLDLLAKDKLEKFLGYHLPTNNYHLSIAYFNHAMQRNADKQEKLVKQLAQKYGVDFFTEKTKKKLRSETEAREARYAFLNRIAEEICAERIATAHHADDAVETILFNLIRGSGIAGLGGMSELNGKIWRPLLTISKAQLEAYAKKNKLKWVKDPTNQNINYKRNFIRKEILPRCAKINPQVTEAILRIGKQARENAEFMKLLAVEWLRRFRKRNTIPLTEFNSLPIALQREIIREIYLDKIGNTLKLEEKHFSEVLELARSGVGNKQKQFGKLIFKTMRSDGIRVLFGKTFDSR
ncbi:MAG: tRNA lysidine(34) synthetase TilS, partial [Candidatus Gracilibacteria bacterium]